LAKIYLVLAEPGLVAKDHAAHGIGGGNAQTVNGEEVGVHDVLATLGLQGRKYQSAKFTVIPM
jgi:hypothetical protein